MNVRLLRKIRKRFKWYFYRDRCVMIRIFDMKKKRAEHYSGCDGVEMLLAAYNHDLYRKYDRRRKVRDFVKLMKSMPL